MQIRGNETSGMNYISGRRQIYTGFWCRNMKGRGQLEELGIDAWIILKCTYMSIQSTFVVVYISCYKPDTKMLSTSVSTNMCIHLKIIKMWL